MTEGERLLAMDGVMLRAALLIAGINTLAIASLIFGFWLTGGFNNNG